jgi:predicted PurR-regulated permease PerM
MAKKLTQQMSRDRKAAFWFSGFAFFALLLYLLSGVLAPFIAGLAVAYFFDPLADRFEDAGLSRGLSAGVVILTFLGLTAAILILLFPLLQGQVIGLLSRVPDLMEFLLEQKQFVLDLLNEQLSIGEIDNLHGATSYAGNVLGWLGGLLQDVWSGGLAFFNLLSLLVITPLVAFYLLRDWDKIVARFDELLPRNSAKTFREQLSAIDDTIAAFVRGQASVCLVLGIFYSSTLTIAGLDFGLLVGLSTGFLAFIPYVGAAIGLVVGTGLALSQFTDWLPIFLVIAIFLVGQTAESYVLTPRMVGGRVGLHPIWVIFSLLAGGSVFGFTGVLLAVPVTAVIGVLVRFATGRYLESPLYTGRSSTKTE